METIYSSNGIIVFEITKFKILFSVLSSSEKYQISVVVYIVSRSLKITHFYIIK